MAKDRNEILRQFLNNEQLAELLEIDSFDPSTISFSETSKYLLIEAIKKMVLSYSMDDSNSQTIKKINVLVSNKVDAA